MRTSVNPKTKWGLLILFLLGLLLVTILFINHRDNQGIYRGGKVTVINPEEFIEHYSIIGIENLHILNENGEDFVRANIVLKGGEIHDISASDIYLPEVKYINGQGGFLIPGLIDTHVHLANSKNDLYLYLANGVTGICEMFGNQTHVKWKEEERNGSVSPAIFVATPKLGRQGGLKPMLRQFYRGQLNYSSRFFAKNAVRKFKSAGFDAIKIGSFMDQEMYDAVLEESEKLGIEVVGHIGHGLSIKSFLESSQSQLSHIDEITKHLEREFGGLDEARLESYVEHVRQNATSIAISLKENHKKISTTFGVTLSRPSQSVNLEGVITKEEVVYVNPAFIRSPDNSGGWKKLKSNFESESILQTRVEAARILTRALAEEKVQLMAGSDGNMYGTVPGFSMHEELEALASCNIANDQLIKMATENGAEFMKVKAGRISTGYEADLILLKENPLLNISNTRSISVVFFGNHILKEDQRKKMLEAIKEANLAERTSISSN